MNKEKAREIFSEIIKKDLCIHRANALSDLQNLLLSMAEDYEKKEEKREWSADIKLLGKLGTENEYKTLAHTKLENLKESEAKSLIDKEPKPKLPEKLGHDDMANATSGNEDVLFYKINAIIDYLKAVEK